MAKKKTWTEKLDGRAAPEIVTLEKPFAGVPAGARLLILTPRLVEAYARAIPPGETRTLIDLRQHFARDHGADACCPTSTSIFARIVAEAALEQLAAGAKDPAPFWRLIDPSSPLAKKLSCGPDLIRHQRALEAGAGLKTG